MNDNTYQQADPTSVPQAEDRLSASQLRKPEETIVEAILFASDSPLTPKKIAQVGELECVRTVRKVIDTLNSRYEQAGSAFRIEAIAGGYQMLTQPEYHDVLSRLVQTRSQSRMSQAAMETLAIVAYRQPVLRADIEAIRGVACGDILRGLMEKQLVKIVGRADVVGRPILYGTTRQFLEVFGLASLEDLPKIEELRSGATVNPKPQGESEAIEKPNPDDESARPTDQEEPPKDDPSNQDQAGSTAD